jgi:hypothetical protein
MLVVRVFHDRDRVARWVALLRALSDRIGLTAGLSMALASGRLLVHDRDRVGVRSLMARR